MCESDYVALSVRFDYVALSVRVDYIALSVRTRYTFVNHYGHYVCDTIESIADSGSGKCLEYMANRCYAYTWC